MVSDRIVQETVLKLAKLHSNSNLENIKKSVTTLASHWLEMDGKSDDFQNFCERGYISETSEKNALFIKVQNKLEKIFGFSLVLYWSNKWSLMMETGSIQVVDTLLAEIDPLAHINEDLYKSKLAHFILLNFPLLSLEIKNKLENNNRDRLLLAQCRLAELCRSRIPADIATIESSALNSAWKYINYLKFDVHRILAKDQNALSKANLTVDIHWGLRDQINFLYREQNGFEKQLLLYKIWERATLEEVPSEYYSNSNYFWDPMNNLIYNRRLDESMEGNSFYRGRYKVLLDLFQAKKKEDLYSPHMSNYIHRSFEYNYELEEDRVRKLLMEFLTNPLISHCAAYLKKILKRELVPFDIIFNQFEIANNHVTMNYDELVKTKYQTLSHFHQEIPLILKIFGFDSTLAENIAKQIQVVSCRTGGFSSFPKMRGGKFILATTTDNDRMNYTSFITAMHELGHCVEGYLSLEMSDYYVLGQVPPSAFTEAFAYLFDSRSLEILQAYQETNTGYKHKILNLFWSCFLNCGIALVDMDCWRWMYDHPDCTETELKSAVLTISKDIWNRFYFPIIGEKNSTILAGYNVMITNPLYLPEYALAIFIQTQIEQWIKDKSLGLEMIRMCKIGCLTPDQWMLSAAGEPISSRSLLKQVEFVLQDYFPITNDAMIVSHK
jgi:hypothetical protein